ncbi:MAG: RelA/SpoT family protein [Candidatus Gracilibacteria bacterium]
MITPVLTAAKKYLPDLDTTRILHAYEFAKRAHEGQTRKDGSPYINHPVSATRILTDLRVDEDTLIACLLHDVPEDTSYTLKDIKAEFGEKVEFLVDGITKLSKVHYRNEMEERQIESLKKLFLHSAKDPRIILVKLADRLHNMQTIDAIPNPLKRERIARETLEIFVPIANLLGIWELKNQLEDCCFHVLASKEYDEIAHLVEESMRKKANVLKKTIKKIENLLKSKYIENFEIMGRQKNLYSIYLKMLRSGKSFHEIYDLLGVRVLVPDIGTCYQVLGILHQSFTPKIGRLKDYIAIPKANGYQSIHTTVFGLGGIITEFQIRTYDMHLENEYGIAAHYFYSKADKKQAQVKKKFAKKYEWVKQILDMQRNISNNKQFLEHLKLDIFEDRIFVFTPKGDVIDLPLGSSVLDFAYQIHSDVGMLAVSADVNGHLSPINTQLKSGDIVYVHTSEESDGPQAEWLDSVHTSLARTRIREFLKEKDRTSIVGQAEELVDHKIKILGFLGIAGLTDLQKIMVLEHYEIEEWEDLLYEIGNGTINVQELIHVLFTEQELFGEEHAPVDIKSYERIPRRKFKDVTPRKVHHISIMVESNNRIGLLRDLCNELATTGVNIVMLQSLPNAKNGVARVDFVLEIVDFNQYESTMRAVRKVDGVLNVTRMQTAPTCPTMKNGNA